VAFDLTAELESIVAALERAELPYAVCGGLAVNIHGHVRSTHDIDLLVPPDAVEAVLDSIAGIGFTLRAGPIPFGAGTDRHRELHRASKILGGDVLTVDLLVVTPVLVSAWEGREIIEWRGHRVPTVSRQGLLDMKRLAGRYQDLADIEALERGGDA
jgi:hypothetical protein